MNSTAPVSTTTTECNDCGGPLAQAFPTTRDYVRCRRCGHVTPAPSRAVRNHRPECQAKRHGWSSDYCTCY